MSDVFYARPTEPPVTPDDVKEMGRGAGGCLDLYRVEWKLSFLATDGGRMLCWYRAPDAESARQALNQLGSDMNAVWAGEFLEGAETRAAEANLVVERVLNRPLDSASPEILPSHGARGADIDLLGAILSRDRLRLVALYKAADVESVDASFVGGESVTAAWSCRTVRP